MFSAIIPDLQRVHSLTNIITTLFREKFAMALPPISPLAKPMTLALALTGLALAAALPLTFMQLSPEYRVWNASVIGALAVFTAARLGLGWGLVFTAAGDGA